MENNDIKPSTIMLIAGGAVLFISTFLDWISIDGGEFFGDFGANAWETDAFGLLGIICAVIGLIIGGGVAATQFGNVSMPDKILGFNHDQLHLILGAEALLITFGLFFRGDLGIGLILGLLASIAIVVGAFMDLRAADGGGDAAPTQF
ncbi:MAG: hypothetical protein DHS20C19_17580 [Acidimicrobiales bacterium]|nr:MAG: hypothetical protein DHS20C19_17580 [Acidimicrobiales bacterium]